MATKAARSGVRFRPHFKTHQSAAIGEWFKEVGVSGITVSSVRMAAYFVEAGWKDITIAFPVNVREIGEIDRLATQARIGLLVDSVATAHVLASMLSSSVDIWLEVDAGYHRSGIDGASPARAIEVARVLRGSQSLHLRGLLTHSGNSYGLSDLAALRKLHESTLARLIAVRDALSADGWPRLEISIGDTPIATRVDVLGEVDEIRPGNFLFFDWMQYAAGVCREEQIAVAVACPVVAIYPERHEVVIYGGAVHLSKDFVRNEEGAADYGHLAPLSGSGWGPAFPDVWLRSLSQEHGVVTATPETFARHLLPLNVGSLLAVLPIHSCLTADLLKRYMTLQGEIITMMVA